MFKPIKIVNIQTPRLEIESPKVDKFKYYKEEMRFGILPSPS